MVGAPPTSPLSYAWRRALRIVPAYWVALTVLAAYAHLHGVFTGDWWRYYFFLQIYSAHTIYGGLAVAWTLCVEVTFYILLPFYGGALARLAARWRVDRIRLEIIVLTGLAIASLAVRAIDLSGSNSVLTASILENFDWFALGMLLAVLSVALQDGRRVPGLLEAVRRRPAMCWLSALGLYLLVAAVVHYPVVPAGPLLRELPFRGMVRHIAFGVIAVLIVLPAAVSPPRGVPARVLGWRVLAWLGLISYGIYLWHSPLVGKLIDGGALTWWSQMTFVVLTIVTIAWAVAAAAVSYYVIERPFLALKPLTPGRR